MLYYVMIFFTNTLSGGGRREMCAKRGERARRGPTAA